MTDIKHILSLPSAERDEEIRKLRVPKPWIHRDKYHGEDQAYYCTKCNKRLGLLEYVKGDCPIPDRIPLDANLAMKMFRKAFEQHYELWRKACAEIYKIAVNPEPCYTPDDETQFACDMWYWWNTEAKEHHCILAAIKAKEKE